ncbi:MAG TPA: hypothetical protein VK837_14440 [Longimicrobiales bacterium]|nr:hypothetical protein [Longimicrobiales bacterium]
MRVGTGVVMLLFGLGAVAPSAAAQDPKPSSVGDFLSAVNEALSDPSIGASAQKGLGTGGFSRLSDLAKSGAAAARFGEFATLTPEDEAARPDLDPAGLPQIPSHCADLGASCARCYGDAQAELENLRVYFEQLRRVDRSTRRYYSAAMSVGDGIATLHMGAALAWQEEKIKIARSMQSFDASVEVKQKELLERLQDALRTIGACESEHFGVDDWYDRFGFVYYNFFALKYGT